jgi:hypothetical protein
MYKYIFIYLYIYLFLKLKNTWKYKNTIKKEAVDTKPTAPNLPEKIS